jgi:hypothetical protein
MLYHEPLLQHLKLLLRYVSGIIIRQLIIILSYVAFGYVRCSVIDEGFPCVYVHNYDLYSSPSIIRIMK